MRKNTLLLVIVLIMAIGLNGCLGKKHGDPSVIIISPDTVNINFASGISTATLTASVKDEKNNTINVEGEDIEWEIDNSDVAALDKQKGLSVTLQANTVGETKVTAKYGDLDAAEITVNVIDEEIMPESGYKAPKVAAPLVLGEEWSVKEENAYNFFEQVDGEDVGWNLWVFWDEANVYIQYDVYTDYPLGNTHTGAEIWKADSLEWEIRTSAGDRQKWIVGLTDNGYEIVVRYPDRTFPKPGEGVDLQIEETDFGYRGQLIISQDHEPLAEFNIDLGLKLEMAVQVNDSIDGVERTRILGGFVDSGTYTDLWFMFK